MNTPETAPAHTLAATVLALAARIRALPEGDRATLRRMDPEAPDCPAFWRLTGGPLADQLPSRESDLARAERRWAVIIRAIANAETVLAPGRRLGLALAEAGVSEPRVLRLLQAHDEQLAVHLRTLVQQLTQRGAPFDPVDLAYLVLSDGRDDEDTARRRIARDYFQQTQKAEA